MIVGPDYSSFRAGAIAGKSAGEMIMAAFEAFASKVSAAFEAVASKISAVFQAFAAAPLPPIMTVVAMLLAIAAVFSQRRGRERLLMLVLAIIYGVTAWVMTHWR